MKIRVGIFFGGSSREREISFAGGRTVYDNLDKALFDAVPIFIDSDNELIELDWKYIYKGTIRDFYPPVAFHPTSEFPYQIYLESLGKTDRQQKDQIIEAVGKRIQHQDLKSLIDIAFLALHGSSGEDGSIQGLLDYLNIPYTGSGILPSAIGMNKAIQKKFMNLAGFGATAYFTITRSEWEQGISVYDKVKQEIGFPCVIRPANQGSSIGVSILQADDEHALNEAVKKAFFCKEIDLKAWRHLQIGEKHQFIQRLTDIRDQLGLPVVAGERIVYHPQELLTLLDATTDDSIQLRAYDGECELLIEEFIDGKEFSCIVIQNEAGEPIALPPTEIVKGKELFDYRSKYLAGLSRKITPIQLPDEEIHRIRMECERLFRLFEFNVYARIDGFYKNDGTIILNDPNTTSGMLPSSFFFHQAAEIGLNPSQFLTYILYTSLSERIRRGFKVYHTERIREQLLKDMDTSSQSDKQKIRVAVLLGGYSSERHISVESGRNIYEKLSSSDKYEPIPVFVMGDDKQYSLWQIPINILLKDNADDIRDKILQFKKHSVIESVKKECIEITGTFATLGYRFEPRQLSFTDLAQEVQAVFIALHGRPGEDGTIQRELDKVGLPYNGSTPDSSEKTINKYVTNQLLKRNGLLITEQTVVSKSDWIKNQTLFFEEISKRHHFPLIVKPVDDGCSSAVKKINNTGELQAFTALIFRDHDELDATLAHTLKLKPKEEFPRKQEYLVEDLIQANGAIHFLEITGGLLTHMDERGQITYELFEPSETLTTNDVLSLEEKFLAGEGLNITPARFSKDAKQYEHIMEQVKRDLEKAARTLQVTGYCRIDAFVRIFPDGRVETIVIEINSLPGMTPATCIFHQAALHKYKPYDFIDKILTFSFNKKVSKANSANV
jgi:D-alanine-D-alanine ligase